MTTGVRALAQNPGPGFCYSRNSGFCLADSGFGPLLIAFDSNIVINLEQHGSSILDDVRAADVDPRAQQELDALGHLLEIWRTRDLRFIALPQLLSDFKREPPEELRALRARSRLRIVDAMAYQLHDDDIIEVLDRLTGSERTGRADQLPLSWDGQSLLNPLDAQLIREAISCEVDVFLTNDLQLCSAVRRMGLPINALSPIELIELFGAEHVGLLGEDHSHHQKCEFGVDQVCDDTGKWGPLFAILEEGMPPK